MIPVMFSFERWYSFIFTVPCILSIVTLGILGTIVYRRYFHPLSKYPGPFLWSITRIPFALSLQRGHLVHDTKRFHDHYGTIVRLAPNELSFIDPDAWHDIYGHRKRGHKEFMKNPIWTPPSPNGAHSLINAAEKDHPRLRKPLVPAFSLKAMREQEGTMQHYVDVLIRQLKSKCVDGKEASVAMRDYYNWTTFDIMGDLGFGESFGCLENDEYHPWVSFLYGHLKDGALKASVRFYPWLASALFFFVPKSAFKAANDHFAMSCDKLRRRIASDTDRKDFISYILPSEGFKRISMPELEATAALLIVAGSESTSTQMTATTNYLVRNSAKLQKLVGEIRSTFHHEDEITLRGVENMEYMKAVLQEGMRLGPPVPTQIPRIVPPEGDMVCGEMLPGNTFVGVPQFAAYRHASFFSHADEFYPERWLPAESAYHEALPQEAALTSDVFALDAKRVVQPFSVGPRNCIGMNLAYAEMRLVFARILYNFDLRLPDLKSGEENFKFEDQKTFALWEREPCIVTIKERSG